jgi:hypothetical protein
LQEWQMSQSLSWNRCQTGAGSRSVVSTLAIEPDERIALQTASVLEKVGGSLAGLLQGAWRRSPPPACCSVDQFAQLVCRLLETGAAGVAWWRIRQTAALAESSAGRTLQQCYRMQVLHAALATRHLERVVQRLQAAGVEPLLGKGWVAAQAYAERGLRPSGDIDFYVCPEQFKAAQTALGHRPPRPVDLHAGCPDLPDRTIGQLYSRSRSLAIGQIQVRVFGLEDHLRLLCLHFLRHGAWRPLWLCDVAAALELGVADFDWDYFFSGNKKSSDGAGCVIGLARQLLEADVGRAPRQVLARSLPSWLVPAVLRQWGSAYHRYTDARQILAYLHRPEGFWRALRQRWPNPIEATVSLGGPFNAWPRFPFQVGDCLLRAARLLTIP